MTEEEACKQALSYIEYDIEEGFQHIRQLLSKMEDTSNPWDFIKKKALVMKEIISMLPLCHDSCPFCLISSEGFAAYFPSLGEMKIHRINCNKCEYGKFHGKCAECQSLYGRISTKLEELEGLLTEYGRVPDDMEEK